MCAQYNDISVKDGPNNDGDAVRLLNYNTYFCVKIAYGIQYSNILYRFLA
jgi:hypothetical protein